MKDRGWSGGAQRLGPHLHFVKGRAAFELAAMGAVTSPGELLQEAQADLEEARKLDPNNAQIYRYLAEVFVKKGEAAASRGNADQKNAAEQQADEILAEAVRAAGDVPEAHINRADAKTDRGAAGHDRGGPGADEGPGTAVRGPDAAIRLQCAGLRGPGAVLLLLRGLPGLGQCAGETESSHCRSPSRPARWRATMPNT